MSIIRPAFLRVIPADIERVGPSAACVLALVRYVTALDGACNGRLLMSDHQMWWHATYTDIAASTGLTPKAVRGAVGQLEASGELKSYVPGKREGDHTKIYRMPSDQELPCGAASDQKLADSPGSLPPRAGGLPSGAGGLPCGAAEAALWGNSSSSFEELKEEPEEHVEASAPPTPRARERARARDGIDTVPPTADGVEVAAEVVDEADYQAARHAKEASKRTQSEPEDWRTELDRLLERGARAAKERGL